ncbi:MAG: aminotransferase class IV [Candidatus Didemnitutus sp.]|nr:aminotransferase class IV [Candidatus Didemnitutus sp.]
MSSPNFVQANTKGRLHSAAEPVISPLDRGFLYGDAVYEVWRTYEGVVFTFAEHWTRLEASAAALYLTLPFDAEGAWRELVWTVAAFRAVVPDVGDLYIRLQISRGGGAIGLDPALADEPTWVFLVQALPAVAEEKMRAGLRVVMAEKIRRNHPSTLNPAWKTGNYLNNVLALREAKAKGADEVLLLNLAGEITEASTMIVAFVRGGEVITPPLEAGILPGITRRVLIEQIAPRAGVPMRVERVLPEDLASMDEAFFLSTTKDVTPIASIDGRAFRLGDDTVTLRLKAAFADYAREQTLAHPERAVPQK